MKKFFSIAILIILVLSIIMPVNTYAKMDLSMCKYEDLETTLEIEKINNCDLSKYNQANSKRVNIYIFRGNGCINCNNLYKYYITRRLLANYGDKINIVSFEVRENTNNFYLMDAIKRTMGEAGTVYYTPYVIIGNKTFSGDLVVENAEEKQNQMENAIMEQWNSSNRYDVIKEVCGTTIQRPNKFPFTDVKSSDWYYNSVKFVYENKIILGTTDTLFKPNNKLTRGQLATIIWRMAGEPIVEGKEFPDVKETDYYYKAVQWASKNKIVNGYKDGRFGPKDNVTREQLAVMLNNYAKYKGKDISKTTNISGYKDASGVSSYAIVAVKWAIANKIISGKDNGTRIEPRGLATRAEVSAMLQRYCVNIGK